MSERGSGEEETLIPRDTAVIQHPDHPLRLNIITGTAVLAQVGIWGLVLTIYYATLRDGPEEVILASYHPLANSLGALLVVNAVLLLQPTHTPDQKVAGAKGHGWLNLLGLASFLVGVVVILVNKSNHGAAHFTSVHGKVGLVAVVLLVTQVVLGAAQFWFPRLLGGEARAKSWYKVHRASGYLLLGLLLLNVTLGTQTPYFRGKVDHLWIWIVFDAFILLGLVPRIKPSKMKLF